MNPNDTAEAFAKYIVENKPYLVEIDEAIQTFCRGNSEGKMKLEIHIRGNNVMRVDFWEITKNWKRPKLT